MYPYKRILPIIVLLVSLSLAAQQSIHQTEALDAHLFQLKKELELAKTNLDTSNIAQAYLKLGDFFRRLALSSEAINNYQAFLELYKATDKQLVYVLQALATINHDLKKYQKANKYASNSLVLSESINFFKGKAQAHALLGSVAEKQGFYDKALEYQKLSLSIFKTLNDSTGLAITNENIGSIYEDLTQYDLAYQYFITAQGYAKNSDTDLQINIINNLGDTYRKTGHYSQALGYTQQALERAQETNNQSQIKSALKDLAKTYADLGNFKTAYTYLNNQSIVNEQELKQSNAQIVSAMEVLYEVREKEAEVALLNKQNQLNKVRQYVILTVTGALILALVLGLLYWKKRRHHDKRILEFKQRLLQADLDKKTTQEEALKREIDIKVSALTNYSLHIAHKNKMLSDVSKTLTKLKDRNRALVNTTLQNLVDEIESDVNNNNEWTELMGYFGQIHPAFFKVLKQQALEKLSSSEMRLCLLLRLNLSSKEIAEILRITSDSVRIARYRLRKKLPLRTKDDLQAYLLNL